jgi:hypothetical protein
MTEAKDQQATKWSGVRCKWSRSGPTVYLINHFLDDDIRLVFIFRS